MTSEGPGSQAFCIQSAPPVEHYGRYCAVQWEPRSGPRPAAPAPVDLGPGVRAGRLAPGGGRLAVAPLAAWPGPGLGSAHRQGTPDLRHPHHRRGRPPQPLVPSSDAGRPTATPHHGHSPNPRSSRPLATEARPAARPTRRTFRAARSRGHARYCERACVEVVGHRRSP